MTFLHRFRSPIIALVGVVFSATIVLAGQPAPASSTGLSNAASHAGKTVPTASDGQSSQDETTETETNDGSENSSDSANNCNVDLTGDLSSFSHGQIVCSAAHSSFDTATYANRGAWVSHWAKQNHGADASATGKSHQPSH